MTADRPEHSRLVADVGGTNTRLALFDTESQEFTDLRVYRNRQYSGLEEIMESWLQDLPSTAPAACCIAVAAPPSDDLVRMSNIDWAFSCRELSDLFGFDRVSWLNDFQANAYSLPYLQDADRAVLHRGTARADGKLAVMGPGTGLGGATLERVRGQPVATTCEPGHMGLAPGTTEELELFAQLLPRYGELHAERLVSGPGLLLLYQSLATISGRAAPAETPDEISRAALRDHDDLCQAALAMFCGLLGSACGDFVLANGAYSGLYLAGGILPGMLDFLRRSTFHQRFCNKGAMRDHLQEVPVYAITASQPGLLGAAHAPL
jgi:glucokinase